MIKMQARALLFSAIEGGNTFWNREIDSHGPVAIVEKIRSGGYAEGKFERTLSIVKKNNPDEVLDAIHQVGATFITPDDIIWPALLNDLAIANGPLSVVAHMALIRLLTKALLSPKE